MRISSKRKAACNIKCIYTARAILSFWSRSILPCVLYSTCVYPPLKFSFSGVVRTLRERKKRPPRVRVIFCEFVTIFARMIHDRSRSHYHARNPLLPGNFMCNNTGLFSSKGISIAGTAANSWDSKFENFRINYPEKLTVMLQKPDVRRSISNDRVNLGAFESRKYQKRRQKYSSRNSFGALEKPE